MGKLQKLDSRIQTMLQNGIRERHRTVFVMIGNKGQDQVPIMHQILNSLFNKGRLSVLWCYKKELSFSTHRKKNLKLLNKKRKAGLTSDATIFEQFICTTDIRWCYYSETHKILGQTFDMCILQDFEALTPNTLARTIETVVGGGLIIFLLKSMDSLKQLCTMAMDVHARYRTEAHQDAGCRFNERFLLSLTSNTRCLVLDDRWQVLPLSKKVLNSINVRTEAKTTFLTTDQQELQRLKVSLAEDGSPFAPVIKLCVTLDQARSLIQFCASVAYTSQTSLGSGSSDVSNRFSTAKSLLDSIGTGQTYVESSSAIVIVTAGRGRGKSAALGLGLAAAIESGLPNLYVTAPSPENLCTLMQFAIRGLMAFGYEEHQDYIVTKSSDPEYNSAVIRIDVHRQNHRQSLVYLPPWEMANQLAGGGQQADLVCVDEAAAIPLTLVRLFISGPRLVFMASTINGYEGTGRSLSLKLIKQLRSECKLSDVSLRLQSKASLNVVSETRLTKDVDVRLGKSFRSANTLRALYEVTLNEAIRYASGDPVEAWLSELLCLDCGVSLIQDVGINPNAYYPPVDQCQLYYVNRDTLFAYHKSTELFLHRLMALYVASHYKNSPNDLQLLSDAPAHHIFCLLAPYNPESGKVPEVLCVLQVCLEGQINKNRVLRSLSRGLRPSGDLIPWVISQQFCDPHFGELSGARVVRIATHPEYQNLGYGSRALSLLHDYYSGKLYNSSSSGGENKSDDLTAVVQSTMDKDSKRKSIDLSATQHTETSQENDDEKEGEEESEEEELIEDEISSAFDVDVPSATEQTVEEGKTDLLTERIERRGPSSLPPLLSRLTERPPEQLHYVGVSFGAMPSLLRFWKRSGYMPVYLRQTLNELTGEFTCIMIKQLDEQVMINGTSNWLVSYNQDFIRRFICLLPGCFRYLDASYALELIHHKLTRHHVGEELTNAEAVLLFTQVDMERLRYYTRSLIDFYVVSDLLPRLAQLYFAKRLPEVRLNKTQQVILLGLGLQYKTVERLATEFTRLLGGCMSKPMDRCAADNSATMLAQANEAHLNSSGVSSFDRSAVGVERQTQQKESALPDTTVNVGWSKRIRGLLFVIVRELVRALDVILGSKETATSTSGFTNNQSSQLLASTVRKFYLRLLF
ncbi:RNA cytidine acetyltransferase [Paragonimus heterotremus]|uniref:RNA cytidine acetyltransferase n=1 Tax=Paragonimus heterotremus TaxID=100268 RepID=A0A8J4SL16_9TREM|nr:RNA cytidine acetyltransferase [Paragonimus heterotremus]